MDWPYNNFDHNAFITPFFSPPQQTFVPFPAPQFNNGHSWQQNYNEGSIDSHAQFHHQPNYYGYSAPEPTEQVPLSAHYRFGNAYPSESAVTNQRQSNDSTMDSNWEASDAQDQPEATAVQQSSAPGQHAAPTTNHSNASAPTLPNQKAAQLGELKAKVLASRKSSTDSRTMTPSTKKSDNEKINETETDMRKGAKDDLGSKTQVLSTTSADIDELLAEESAVAGASKAAAASKTPTNLANDLPETVDKSRDKDGQTPSKNKSNIPLSEKPTNGENRADKDIRLSSKKQNIKDTRALKLAPLTAAEPGEILKTAPRSKGSSMTDPLEGRQEGTRLDDRAMSGKPPNGPTAGSSDTMATMKQQEVSRKRDLRVVSVNQAKVTRSIEANRTNEKRHWKHWAAPAEISERDRRPFAVSTKYRDDSALKTVKERPLRRQREDRQDDFASHGRREKAHESTSEDYGTRNSPQRVEKPVNATPIRYYDQSDGSQRAQGLPALFYEDELQEWLEMTGFHNREYRRNALRRHRELIALDMAREKIEREAQMEYEERTMIYRTRPIRPQIELLYSPVVNPVMRQSSALALHPAPLREEAHGRLVQSGFLTSKSSTTRGSFSHPIEIEQKDSRFAVFAEFPSPSPAEPCPLKRRHSADILDGDGTTSKSARTGDTDPSRGESDTMPTEIDQSSRKIILDGSRETASSSLVKTGASKDKSESVRTGHAREIATDIAVSRPPHHVEGRHAIGCESGESTSVRYDEVFEADRGNDGGKKLAEGKKNSSRYSKATLGDWDYSERRHRETYPNENWSQRDDRRLPDSSYKGWHSSQGRGRSRDRGSPHRTALHGDRYNNSNPRSLDLLRGTRFFIVKSFNFDNVEKSQKECVWTTQARNGEIFGDAFRNSENVILLFSVNQSVCFQGYARMESAPGDAKTPSWADGLRWKSSPPFKIRWISIADTHFNKVGHLKNGYNDNQAVLIGRDGQEVEGRCGAALCEIIDQTADFKWVR